MQRGKAVTAKKAKQPSTDNLLCSYPHRVCMQNRHETYDYCLRHILEDRTAPFKQCGYVYPKNGKRCPNVASKSERREGYCGGHAQRAPLLPQTVRMKRPPETPVSLIQDLDHYNVIDDYSNPNADVSTILSAQALTMLPLQAPVPRINQIIEYTSDSDSDCELPNVEQTWKGNAESDAESIDSEQDDPLKHAGVYTAEEATLITRDKLIRLQSLYIEQFKRLQHVLRERRRKYLQNVKQERESQSGNHGVPRSNMKEYNQYRKLKYQLRYHRLNGSDLLMHHQSKEKRRSVTEGANYKPPVVPKCIHPEKDRKCGQRALPCTKYCVKHILDDPIQVLYRPCGAHDGQCFTPIVPIVDMNACDLHCVLPSVPPPVPLHNPVSQANPGAAVGPLDSLAQTSEDVCGSAALGLNIPSDMLGYGDSPSGSSLSFLTTSTAKELWTAHLETPEVKLREELQSIDLTPGDLPPEQLLATS